MARRRPRTNPFYILLVVIGIAFTVTACAYFVMALRGSGTGGLLGRAAEAGESAQVLLEFLDHHGLRLMVGELVLLALATCGAIFTDGWWNGEPRDGKQRDVTDGREP